MSRRQRRHPRGRAPTTRPPRRPGADQRRLWTALGSAVVAVVVGAGLLLHRGDTRFLAGPGPSPAPTVGADRPAGPPVGAQAPDLSGRAWSGAWVDLRRLRGRVVLVTFFAAACQGCAGELAIIERAAGRDQGQGLRVIGVDPGPPAGGPALQRRWGLTFPVLGTGAATIARRYRVGSALPLLVFVARDGRVAAVIRGPLMAPGLARALRRLLG
ncbi:MAG TPA: TlpA disulfide reductase family protein [Candidatus Dormibacteraeota bacterium]|nr:TlpA disulfide reductase family protein [Candidatus Dormibacteraeota bacterium]